MQNKQYKEWLEALNFALSFLTRLGVPRMAQDAVLARSVACFAVAGLAVGLVCTVPLAVAQAVGWLSSWALAWAYVALDVWITRGLHYDGVADVGDAWGSGAQGEKFWEILRDSRLGAFGGMALFLCLSGMLLGAQAQWAGGHWAVLVLAPVFGRCVGVLLAHLAPAHDARSLGGKACAGATRSVALGHALLALGLALVVPLPQGLVVLALSAVLVLALRRLAFVQGGSNGDIIGASMVGAQMIYLLP